MPITAAAPERRRAAAAASVPSAPSAQEVVASHQADETGELFGIGELCAEFGITLRSIRFYEDKGLLAPRQTGPLNTNEDIAAICKKAVETGDDNNLPVPENVPSRSIRTTMELEITIGSKMAFVVVISCLICNQQQLANPSKHSRDASKSILCVLGKNVTCNRKLLFDTQKLSTIIVTNTATTRWMITMQSKTSPSGWSNTMMGLPSVCIVSACSTSSLQGENIPLRQYFL